MMTAPVCQIADMLESRRVRLPNHGVILTRCNLTSFKSMHILFDSIQMAQEIRSAAMDALLTIDGRQSSRRRCEPLSHDTPNPVGDYVESVTRGWNGSPGARRVMNRRLWWRKGLEREPEQLIRMQKLNNEGLELWITDNC